MDESALWEKIPQGKLTVPLWYTTRVFPLWETQRAVNAEDSENRCHEQEARFTSRPEARGSGAEAVFRFLGSGVDFF